MRTGTKIIATSMYGQIIYPSKRAIARTLKVKHDRIDEFIDKRIPVEIDGKEYWLDELIELKAKKAYR